MYQNYRFVEYTPRKCFKSFVQSSFDARRERIENPHSGVVAEMMKLLGNSSYGYQFMGRSRHTLTKYLDDEKTNKAAMNEKFFNRLNVLPDHLLKNHSVNCLLMDKDKQPYKDHLCLFRALKIYLHDHRNLDAHTSQLFTVFVSEFGQNPKNFLGVSFEDLPLVEVTVERNIFIYGFDIQEEESVAESTRRSMGKFEEKKREIIKV